MKISYNWIQEYLDFPLPPVTELVTAIGAQLGAVEEVVDYGAKYKGVVVARIVSCRLVEESDHLSVCLIDDGQVVPAVERNADGFVQVVCGAPNVREGLLVAWLPPGSVVPSSFDKQPFTLGARKLRGYMSNGMLASPQELALGDSHEGILEVDFECQPGADFGEIYKLNDFIIDIENKMFTHRPDCFGILGVAREIAGILGHSFNEPDWFATFTADLTPSGPVLPLQIRNDSPNLVPRFMAVALSAIEIKPSPIWQQALLCRVGVRPINNIVDTTNYFMYLTGQPLHAYDYDKVRGLDGAAVATLVARESAADDKLELLNGKAIEPRAGAVVIATASQVIGLAGVMGGASTEVDATTTSIILECATFEMYSIRRTSMTHGIFSEAVTRFNKGQSPYQNDRILVAAGRFICNAGSAEFASDLLDEAASTLQVNRFYTRQVEIDSAFITARLGLDLPVERVAALLSNVGFKVETVVVNQALSLQIQVPFWRTDIELREDIVEEVGRLYGFDKLPLELPTRVIAPALKNRMLELKAAIRTIMSRAGATEVLTYSFVAGALLTKVGQNQDQAYKITNALSPELQYYRQTLSPSLLEKVHPNNKAGYDQFALFELGKTHIVDSADPMIDGVPAEHDRLACVFAADLKAARGYDGAAYYQARHYLERLLQQLGLSAKVQLIPYNSSSLNDRDQTKISYYETSRSAMIQLGEYNLGIIGEYTATVRKALKLPDYCAGFELDVALLLEAAQISATYQPLPKFPKTGQDICLRVPATTPYQRVYDLVTGIVRDQYAEQSVISVTAIDVFQRPAEPDYKQITLRISLANYQRTLTDVEVSGLLDTIANQAAQVLSAERV